MRAFTRRTIDEFLAERRLAVVGVSRNPRDYSRMLFSELLKRGYDAIPVNPNATGDIEGRPVVASLAAIDPAPHAVLLLVPPEQAPALVAECAAAGVEGVWLRQKSPEAVDFCLKHGMSVIDGECPFMYLADTQWFHRLHGFFHRIA